jgi:hypothetical protein
MQILTLLKVLSIILVALQLTYVVFAITGSATATLIAAQVLSLTAYALFGVLSVLEHGRSITPSTLLTVYMLSLIFCDIIHFGFLYVARDLCSFSALPPAICVIKVALLVCEALNKTLILREPYRHLAPEERAGFFGIAFFWWVNEFIGLGHSKILSLQDMPPLPSYLDARKLREAMQTTWDKRSKHCFPPIPRQVSNPLTKIAEKPEHRFTLLSAQFKLLWRPNLQIVVPRLFWTACRYCQPILITRTISYVSNDLPPLENRNEAFRLILFAFVIYTGMPVSSECFT